MPIKGLCFALAIFTLLFPPTSYCQISYEEENSFYSSNGTDDNFPATESYPDANGYPSRPFDDNTFSASQPVDDEYYSHPPDDSSYSYNETFSDRSGQDDSYDNSIKESSNDGRLPNQISPPGEKVIVIDPRAHAWGAYLPDGQLIRSGLASAGAKWCKDRGRPCRTSVGSFRIFSLGNSDCVSSIYPLEDGGGAPMPYCMFFNGNQGLHGSNQLAQANISHGCVRVSVRDAEWLRFDFVRVGTKVIVKPY